MLLLIVIVLVIVFIVIIVRTVILILVVLRNPLEQLVLPLPEILFLLGIIAVIILEVAFVRAIIRQLGLFEFLPDSAHLKFTFWVLYVEIIIVIFESRYCLVTSRHKCGLSQPLIGRANIAPDVPVCLYEVGTIQQLIDLVVIHIRLLRHHQLLLMQLACWL